MTNNLGMQVWVLVAGCMAWSGCSEPETAQMAQELERIAIMTDLHPGRNAHANQARVNYMMAQEPPAEITSRIQFEGRLGQELLRAGNSEEAIEVFARILDTVSAHPDIFDVSYRLGALDHLALSYLRLGEQENCLANPATDRCLFPISGTGLHTRPRGSTQAIRYYRDILQADPEDLNAVWLLNLAHMTLGSSEEEIDPRWRIPADSFHSGASFARFIDIAPLLGVDVMGLSGGVVLEDLNADGWLDLVVSSWGLRDQLRYFENTGEGHFIDKTAEANLSGLTGGLNLVHADYDNDGDQDILVLRGAWLGEGHPNSLLQNNGKGIFTDVTRRANLYSLHPTQTASWGDFDRDGDLDLFIGNESNPAAGLNVSELYRNRGDGTFEEVAAGFGLDVAAYVKAVVWGDYNNDFWPDLFVSVYGGPNRLYRNENGEGFTDVAAEANVQEPIDSFPAWFWDYDQDGWQDLFVSGWRASAGDVAAEFLGLPGKDEKPRLYRNRQDGTFEDVTEQVGLDRLMYTMGCNVGDLDSDGWPDFYVGTGDPNLRAVMPNRMFRNVRGQRFDDVTASGGFGHLQKGHGIAFADIDHDGDQDVYQVMGGAFEGDVAHNVLFENPGHGHNWLIVHFVGTRSSKTPIGARVVVDTDRRTSHHVLSTGASFGSAPLRLEIGLGTATQIHRLSVSWPATGETQSFEGMPINRIVTITEGAELYEAAEARPVKLGAPRQ